MSKQPAKPAKKDMLAKRARLHEKIAQLCREGIRWIDQFHGHGHFEFELSDKKFFEMFGALKELDGKNRKKTASKEEA